MNAPAGRRPSTPVVIGVGVLGVALPLIIAVVALAGRRWFPVLDLAMTEFRIRDVGSRQTPLIGLPGRIGELPDQGSHPGPLSFWLLAPGYRLFGGSAWAMEPATVMLQLLWISLSMWIGHRRLGWVGVATTAAIVALLIRGYGLTTLIQPWNPYMPLLAWLVILLATWSVYCDDRWMLVPLVVAASFAAQTHIPYLLMAGGLGLSAVGYVLVGWWRTRAEHVRPPTSVLATVGVFVLLWLAPIVDQIRRDPGNVSRLMDHFGSPPEAAIGFGPGLRLLFRHLDLTTFAKLLTGDQRFLQAGFEPDGPIWSGVVLFVIWIGAVVVSRSLDHRPLRQLHHLIGLTLALSFVSMSRIFGERWFYLTLWAWATTTLLLVSVVWTSIAWWRANVAERTALVAQPRLVAAGAVVATLATLSMVVTAPSTDHPEEHLGETVGELLAPTVAALEDGVNAADGPDGTYVIVWDDAYFFGSQAFGLLNELRREGLDARTYDFWSVPNTPSRVVTFGAPITAEIIFATGGFVEQWRGDGRVDEVATVDPRTPEEVAEFDRLRAELVDDLTADGLDDLVEQVDVNLFGVRLDPRISAEARSISTVLINLGQETAVFIGPPGVSL